MKNLHNNLTGTGEIVIYTAPNNDVRVDIRLERETIWASQSDMAKIFGVNTQAITKHLKNIYRDGELTKKETCSKMEQVQIEGTKKVKRNIEQYNLDIIIAVGYRINSLLGTKFRIWANRILKNYLLKGYAINEKRLLEAQSRFIELQTAISLIGDKSKSGLLTGQESELLQLLSRYAKTLTLLEAYDNGKVAEIEGTKTEFLLTYESCMQVVLEIKKALIVKNEAGNLFGSERGNAFEGIIKGLYQTHAGKELYPSMEDKAANLLYLIIKGHPFSDGNKRTGAFLFIYYLDKTNKINRKNGERKINDNALTALALLIAESHPNEKDTMVKITKSLLTDV